mgnify:CR=1 FL=1
MSRDEQVLERSLDCAELDDSGIALRLTEGKRAQLLFFIFFFSIVQAAIKADNFPPESTISLSRARLDAT